MYLITGQIQHYAWGIKGGLTAWRRNSGPLDAAAEPKPEAELWFGAHPNGPSPLVGQPDLTMLDCVEPGEATLLVKLLAAARPLSIQIHPPADQAEATFAAQQADPSLPKLLADSLPKTEMLIAIKPFSVLQGLRDPAMAAKILRQVGGGAAAAADFIDGAQPKAAIRHLLALPADELSVLSANLPSAAAIAGLGAAGVEALAMVVRDYPGDPGCLVAAMMDHRVLKAGEAVYVPVGVVHAYVQGTGVEVMTSSDNVLRLGLTPKAIAVDESLNALNPNLEPEPLQPAAIDITGGGTVRTYRPEGAPFAVQWVHEGQITAPAGKYRLILCVSGDALIRRGDETVRIGTGEAAAVLADDASVDVVANGSTFISTQQ